MEQDVLNKGYYLKNVKLSGYKSIKNVDVNFERGLNIIIGKNASGKTNFMTCLNDSLKNDYVNITDSELGFTGENEIRLVSYNMRRVNFIKNKGFFKHDFSRFDAENKFGFDIYKDDEKILTTTDELKMLDKLESMGLWLLVTKVQYGIPQNYFSIDSPYELKIGDFDVFFENLKFVFNTNNSILIRRVFGSLFTTFQKYDTFSKKINDVRSIISESLNKIKLLKDNLSILTPISDVRYSNNFNIFMNHKETELTITNLFVEFKVGESWHPFSNLSDGTKRLFYIISEVYFSDEDSVILIEEPELGIHPHQLHDLMTFLKEEAENKQIIITTHSPLVLDILNEDELDNIIITKYEDGETKMTHLSEKQKEKAKQYMEQMYLSDYWKHSDLEE